MSQEIQIGQIVKSHNLTPCSSVIKPQLEYCAKPWPSFFQRYKGQLESIKEEKNH